MTPERKKIKLVTNSRSSELSRADESDHKISTPRLVTITAFE